MPELANARHERFAQEYLVDLVAGRAYERAGYKARGNAAEVNGGKLLRNAQVAARIADLKQERARRLHVTQDEVVAELVKLGFANMADYLRVTSAGDPYLDLSALTREQAAALSEVTIEDFTDGRGDDARDVRRVKAKLHDKKGALVKLGEHLGMFGPKGTEDDPVHTVTHTVTDADRQRRLAELRAAADA